MSKPLASEACIDSATVSNITMAFQPIVDVSTKTVFAHEALVRGKDGRGAMEVLAAAKGEGLYALDQACRIAAIEWAAHLQVPGLLSINFMPNGIYSPVDCLRATEDAADRVRWPLNRIVFEVTEHEEIADPKRVLSIMKAYREKGLLTAIDDFGAGYAGLNLLADFQPDLLKIDLALVRGIDTSRTRQAIVRHVAAMCLDLNVRVTAEGIETVDECRALIDLGITLQQGYLFARPLTEGLPVVSFDL